jgi:hypothetical protein
MWFFRPKEPGEKIRNPIQGEFFATESIDGPAEALVRESVQNSLDASAGRNPVEVRITLATGGNALPGSKVAALFGPAWPHYRAIGNGLQVPPQPGAPCPFLLIEDFGTRGLTGDPLQSDPDPNPSVKNPFFLFFRAEGLSAKSGTDLGRWGIGKFVFPRSSLASTHFGLTVRYDDHRRLLMGAVTLKAHRVAGNDSMFSPDGLYGKPDRNGFVLPIDAPEEIELFTRLFRIQRTTEPGLSVVVPFVDPDITFDRLLVAAVKGYFLPLLSGRLTVTVSSGDRSAHLSDTTLDEVIAGYPSLFHADVLHTVSLASAAISTRDEDRITLLMPPAERAARWADDLIPPDKLPLLIASMAAGKPVAIRVPVTVRSRSDGNLSSWFDIHLAADRTGDGRPTFVREGIIISDVRGRRAREVRSLVIIDHKPLATMLGDSENPAHTQWQKDGSNFKGRYTYGPSLITFVADSVGQLLALVNKRSEEADAALTVEFFSINSPEEDSDDIEDTGRRRTRADGTETPPVDVPLDPRPTRIRIVRNDGGFSILPGSSPPTASCLLLVRCAYDIRSGNPLQKWDPADFLLGASDIRVTPEGNASVVNLEGNRAVLRIDGAEFRVRFEGFDANRDVYVRADFPEVDRAGQET